MIELKQVTKQYGQATVLKNITLTVDEPGIYCLLGRNGAGKTTLLKSIAGYQNITSGTIQVGGKPITNPLWIQASAISKTLPSILIFRCGSCCGSPPK